MTLRRHSWRVSAPQRPRYPTFHQSPGPEPGRGPSSDSLLGPSFLLLTAGPFFAKLEPLFDSRFLFGCIAQSVEQWPLKPTVVGSIPTAPTPVKRFTIKYLEWWLSSNGKTTVCGTVNEGPIPSSHPCGYLVVSSLRNVPVAQWIEQESSKLLMKVRFLPGTLLHPPSPGGFLLLDNNRFE